ncbi:MAG: SulP family inorganic anion transporter [Microgenomates group bacterium]
MSAQSLNPFRSWLPLARITWKQDLLAGLAVAIVLVPQALAYAQMAGLPPEIGLYASFLPVLVAALVGSSLFLSTGPVVIVSLLVFTTLSEYTTSGSSEFIAAATVLAILVGGIQLFLGFAKAGKLIRLVSHPVMLGFTNAAAIIIALHQIPKILSVELSDTSHILVGFLKVLPDMHQINLTSFWIGLISFIVLYAGKRSKTKLPVTLIVLTIATLLSWGIGFTEGIVGTVPSGLPRLSMPIFSNHLIRSLFMPALVISLVAFMEGITIAKHLARKTGTHVDPNHFLVSQGFSNLSAGVSGGYPVAGSFSRSALNFASGARTNLAAVFTALFIGVILLTLTPFLYFVPHATLAAVIIVAVLDLITFSEILTLLRTHTQDGMVAIATFVATIGFAPTIDYGILAGVAISLLAFTHRESKPSIQTFLCSDTDQLKIHGISLKKSKINKRILAVLFDHNVLFTNAESIREQIERATTVYENVAYVLLFAEHINFMDSTALDELETLVIGLKRSEITVLLTGLRESLVTLMNDSKTITIIGEEHVFTSANKAIVFANSKSY